MVTAYGVIVHRIAAAYWLALSFWIIVYSLVVPDAPWYVFWGTVIAFAGPEAWAVRNQQRVEHQGYMIPLGDTYSEVMTWLSRMTKPGARFFMWTKGIVTFISACWGWLVYHQASSPGFGAAAGLFVFCVLLWHWIHPEKVNAQ